MFKLEEVHSQSGVPDIRILGVGGAGISITQRVASDDSPFKFFLVDSNKGCLGENLKGEGLLLGDSINPSGLGAGCDLEAGHTFALESKKSITSVISGADMVFVVAGLGGGIGSGAVPVIVDLAESLSIPVITFVTEPFNFEGGKHLKNCQHALDHLNRSRSAQIILPHDSLLASLSPDTPFIEALSKSGQLLANIIQRILTLCSSVGLINVDFSDLCTLVSPGGRFYIGEGSSQDQKDTVETALSQAMNNPLLKNTHLSSQATTGVLAYLEIGPGFNLGELEMVGELIGQHTAIETEVLLGVTINPQWEQQVHVTIMAMERLETINHTASQFEPVNVVSFIQSPQRE